MSDIVERAKKFQDHLRDTNSQEAEELVGELIAEVEKLREEYKRYGDTISQIMEERDSLTKELEELKKRIEAGKRVFDEIKEICSHD